MPSVLPDAVCDRSQAVRSLADFLERPGPPDEVRRYALEAARAATEVLKERHDLTASVLVGEIRSAAVDLLRWTS